MVEAESGFLGCHFNCILFFLGDGSLDGIMNFKINKMRDVVFFSKSFTFDIFNVKRSMFNVERSLPRHILPGHVHEIFFDLLFPFFIHLPGGLGKGRLFFT